MADRKDRTSAEDRTYHHGDLRRALVDAALAATRTGGPSTLSLREVTRSLGVSAPAAYRHFRNRDELLEEAAHEIQLKMAAHMRRRMRANEGASPQERALRRLRGVGLGYIDFATAEPGWFGTAFFGEGSVASIPELVSALPPPFTLLVTVLDEMVDVGALLAEARPGAEFSCWSAVHGCAELMLHGPLRNADRTVVDAVAERVVDDIVAGVRRVV